MKKTEPFNPGENNTYKDADLARQIKGSIPKADFFNQVEKELLNVITAAGMTPSAEDLDQVATAIQRIVNGGIRYQSLYQKLKPVTGGVVVPEDEKIIAWAAVSAETTISFDMSQVTKNGEDDVITFELYINMPTPVTIHWPAGIMWPDNEAPDLSEAGLKLFAFRRVKGVWQGSLNAPFAAITQEAE